jgi:hypothetical protein
MLWNLWRVVLYNLESCRIRLDTLDNAGMHASGRRGRSRGRVQDSVVLILVRITCTSTKCSLALMTCQPPWCLKILEGRWTTKQSPRTEKDHGPLCDCQRRNGFTASLTAVFNWSSLKFMTAITGGAEWIFTGWPLHRREQHQFWSCYEDPSAELNPQLISFKLCRSRLDIDVAACSWILCNLLQLKSSNCCGWTVRHDPKMKVPRVREKSLRGLSLAMFKTRYPLSAKCSEGCDCFDVFHVSDAFQWFESYTSLYTHIITVVVIYLSYTVIQ